MTGRFILLLVGLTMIARPAEAQEGALKVGYVNSQEILAEDPAARQAQEQLNQELESIREQVEQMGQELEGMMQQYEAQQLTMSPQVKEQRQQEILTQRQEYEGRVGALEQQAGQRQQEIVQPVMDRINQIIESIRVEGDYALIFDVAAGSILAADGSLDLTPEVLRRLRTAPAPSPAVPGG
jgi:outer membrane protein